MRGLGANGSTILREASPKANNPVPAGASLLAMEVNDNAGNQTPRGALGFLASKLAPTGDLPATLGCAAPGSIPVA